MGRAVPSGRGRCTRLPPHPRLRWSGPREGGASRDPSVDAAPGPSTPALPCSSRRLRPPGARPPGARFPAGACPRRPLAGRGAGRGGERKAERRVGQERQAGLGRGRGRKQSSRPGQGQGSRWHSGRLRVRPVALQCPRRQGQSLLLLPQDSATRPASLGSRLLSAPTGRQPCTEIHLLVLEQKDRRVEQQQLLLALSPWGSRRVAHFVNTVCAPRLLAEQTHPKRLSCAGVWVPGP